MNSIKRQVAKFFSGKISRIKLVMVCLIVLLYLGTTMCGSPNTDDSTSTRIIHSNGKAFAGSETCKNCHQAISESHVKTAHYLTSQIADTSTIKGSFIPGENTFRLSDRLSFSMENSLLGLFQVGYVDNKEAIRKPIDIVIGSGRKGQTFLYWENHKLFQLPVSYYSPTNIWCNSPGYPTNILLFNRPIPTRCVECHGTFFKEISSDTARVPQYDSKQIIYGVDCERCHGPAAEHVAYQTAHPEDKLAKYIINPALLTRQQKLDNCALCHSGLRETNKPSFSFVAGDKLDEFSVTDYKADSAAELDVHGNQYGLLTASKCFKMSTTMDCSSCHNTHVTEAGNVKLYSQRCMNCHKEAKDNFCKHKPEAGLVLSDNCIDCHMPSLTSKKIVFSADSKVDSTPYFVRTHLIAVYKDQVKLYLNKLKHSTASVSKKL